MNGPQIPQTDSIQQLAQFWDTHDLADFWDQTESVDFEVDIQSEATYYALDRRLSQMLAEVAEERGVSSGTLLNIWIQEKLWERITRTKDEGGSFILHPLCYPSAFILRLKLDSSL